MEHEILHQRFLDVNCMLNGQEMQNFARNRHTFLTKALEHAFPNKAIVKGYVDYMASEIEVRWGFPDAHAHGLTCTNEPIRFNIYGPTLRLLHSDYYRVITWSDEVVAIILEVTGWHSC